MQDYTQIIKVYLDNTNGNVGSQLIKTFEADPSIVAAILTSVFDCLVDKVPEMHQIPFKKRALEHFNAIVSQRHIYANKEPLLNNDN